jgi:acyl-CoA thioester hydrolase
MAGFGFHMEVRVRFAETDAQAVAHHAAYLVWFEMARIDYLARFDGGYPALREQGVEATTSEVYVRYRRPAQFDDRLVVHTRCGELRGARFRFEYAVERSGETIAEGWTSHACVDAATLRPTRVPEWLAEAIREAEASVVGEPPGSPTPPPPVR